MHWGAEEHRKEQIEKGDRAMSPKRWREGVEARARQRQERIDDWVRSVVRAVNSALSKHEFSYVDCDLTLRVGLDHRLLGAMPDGAGFDAVLERYRRQGWQDVKFCGDSLVMTAPEPDGGV